ncbi:pyridoxamine 5'-phosphate oxidase family protein [Agrococcus terreus]|uniref:pyridoxamine 5'-phosphate oxidase family protein n=1 Tax=Agrococcus terreus TaxID=574649 RepID=UPI003850F270
MDDSPVHDISEDECLKLLAAFDMGRIAFRLGDELEMLPVHYHASGREITVATAPGTRLAAGMLTSGLLLEIDHIGVREAWSVVARGRARLLQEPDELAEAEALPIHPLIHVERRQFLRIPIDRITGRRFHRLPEQPASVVSPAAAEEG